MLGKILFTVVVILVILAVARGRQRGPDPGARAPAAAAPAARWPRYLAYGFVATMIGVGSIFFYLDWQESNTVLSVRVINSRTGLTADYRVKRGDMRGRTFTTLDGVTVTLAEEERVEVTDRSGGETR